MMGNWWLLWMLFMFLFFITPIGYGWGYRRWGAPYPTYIQRRRTRQSAIRGDIMTADHLAWGILGDMVWMVLVISMVWALLALWWR